MGPVLACLPIDSNGFFALRLAAKYRGTAVDCEITSEQVNLHKSHADSPAKKGCSEQSHKLIFCDERSCTGGEERGVEKDRPMLFQHVYARLLLTMPQPFSCILRRGGGHPLRGDSE